MKKGEKRRYERESFKQFARVVNGGVTEFFAILSSEGGPMESRSVCELKGDSTDLYIDGVPQRFLS